MRVGFFLCTSELVFSYKAKPQQRSGCCNFFSLIERPTIFAFCFELFHEVLFFCQLFMSSTFSTLLTFIKMLSFKPHCTQYTHSARLLSFIWKLQSPCVCDRQRENTSVSLRNIRLACGGIQSSRACLY